MKFKLLLIFTMWVSFCLGQGGTTLFTNIKNYTIPAAGKTEVVKAISVPGILVISTVGSTDMSGNSYVMSYDSLPVVGSHWQVRADFSNLTADTASVSIFGRKPLSEFPGQTTFTINFVVHNQVGTKNKFLYYNYSSAPFTGSSSIPQLSVTGQSTLNGRVVLTNTSERHFTSDSTVVGIDSSGKLVITCSPWCTGGNAGLNGSVSHIGTLDSASLNFIVNSQKAGHVSGAFGDAVTSFGDRALNVNTAISGSAFGRFALRLNTTGVDNSAFGAGSLALNTTGQANAAFGSCLTSNTTGSYNTGVGLSAGNQITTGSYNTAMGASSMLGVTTGSNNTALGYGINFSGGGLSNSVGVGANATVTASNQMALSDGITSLYMKLNNNTSAGSFLRNDGSGNASWVSQVDDKNLQVSFESGESGDFKFKMDFSGIVTGVYAYAIKAIAGTDSGTIVFKNNAGTTMSGGSIVFQASDPRGTSYTSTPVSNNTFIAGDILTASAVKTTAGGKVLLSIKYTRTQ